MNSTWANLVQTRHLFREVTLADLRGRAAESRFGWLWWMLDPLIMMLVYWGVVAGIFGRGARYAPYPVFLLAGMLPFKHITGALLESAKVLRSKEALIKSVAFPTIILPISGVVSGFVYFLFGMLVLMITALIFERPMTIASIAQLPGLMVCQIVMVTGVSLALASFGAIVRDLPAFMGHLTRLLFYGCPILYGVDMVEERFSKGALKGTLIAEWLPTVFSLNPIAVLLTGYREAVFYGRLMEPQAWAILVLESLLIFALGYRIFTYYDRRVIKFL